MSHETKIVIGTLVGSLLVALALLVVVGATT